MTSAGLDAKAGSSFSVRIRRSFGVARGHSRV
jgi:hypothetical protein